ncbi:sigma-70 family RNA polymerase sigma factor [Streptomyces sp. NPDC051940]|uniref:BACON domain-containing protein n=1 Tax=Streptomyces sp. NPDC051940 TaxID=3155675 RepID=UPI00341BEF5F
MTSSRPDPPRTRGAHAGDTPRRRTAEQPIPQEPPAAYDPYLDGLFTYCLSVLCDHDEAIAALGDVLAIAERRSRRGRAADREGGPAGLRPWLYGLARWACLRRMTRKERSRTPDRTAPVAADAVDQRRRELARLAWPEAAGTSPEQREALELAVRHGLPPDEVAAVLGLDAYAARELLSRAACEVERTQAALAVVERGSCPAVARLAGDTEVLLGAALRRELVRHVDDCPDCRRTAERAGAAAGWPGSLGWMASAAAPRDAAAGRLPVVPAPRAAAHAAMLYAQRTRPVHAPRYDRTGFPQDPKIRAARRDRLRNRAITSTVVATVVAAPVLALWAAYRGAPADAGSQSAFPAASDRADGPQELDGEPVEKAGSAQEAPSPRYTAGSRTPDVSVEVIDSGGPVDRPGTGPGRLTVEAMPRGDATVITLHASGGTAVRWQAWSDASWLTFSRTSGTLFPGQSTTITVSVDPAREPRGDWSARVFVGPSGAEILLYGRGDSPTSPPPSSEPPPSSSPPPTTTPPPDPDPTTPPPTGDPTTPPPSSEPPPSSDPTPTSDPTTGGDPSPSAVDPSPSGG